MNEGKFLSEKTADIVEDPESYNHYIKRLEQKRNKIKEKNDLEKKKSRKWVNLETYSKKI
jgi:hypothetical protein